MRKGRINNSEINNEDLSKGIEIANKYNTRKRIERDKRIKKDINKEERKIKPIIICLIWGIILILLFFI